MKISQLKALLEGYHPDLDVVVGNGFTTVADILPHPTFTTGNPWNSNTNRFDKQTDTPILILNLSIDDPFQL
jgi:hypothetical protein